MGKWSGPVTYAAWLAVTKLPVPDVDLDVHIDVRKRFRTWEKCLEGEGKKVEDLPGFSADFTDAELRYVEKQRAAWGEKHGWPPDLAEGARDLKRRIAEALTPPPANIGQETPEPAPTRQATRRKDREAS